MTKKPLILSLAFERPYTSFEADGTCATDARRLTYGVLCDPINMIIQELDAIPILVPTKCDVTQIAHVMEKVDGVILPGGNSNVHPNLYNASPNRNAEQLYDHDRDKLEFAIFEAAYTQKKPLLGICRGMQSMNVWRGGTLHQSLHHTELDHNISVPSLGRSDDLHNNHELIIKKGAQLENWMGDQSAPHYINSWHGQAVDQLGKGLKVEAEAPDGIIEAIALDDPERFMYGVQWHPDFNADQDASRALLNAFKKAL